MIRPEAEEVHISVSFTWDVQEAWRLYYAWRQHYNKVQIGGPAFKTPAQTSQPGMYVKQGVTFTSRGCNNNCPWCLVPEYEGKIREIGYYVGHIIQDNNLLQCSREHIECVFSMLEAQKRAAILSGGLESSRLKDWMIEDLRSLRIDELFLSADCEATLCHLEYAVQRLSPLDRDKLRCYVLIGFNGEAIQQAETRLRRVWEIGCMPFSQLYQPPDEYIEYSPDWKALNRTWSRPPAMKALMGGVE